MAWKSLVLIVCVAACGDDGGTPSAKTLQGYWNTESPSQTVMAFIAADKVGEQFVEPELALPPNQDLSVVFLNDMSDGGLSDFQISTYKVNGDALIQTVIGDVQAPPGTMYSTSILDFDGETMTLESKNDPTGMRTYTRSSRCPNESWQGWSTAAWLRGVTDLTQHDAGVAIDAKGHVHSLTGSIGEFASYNWLGDGCTPFVEKIPAFRQGAIALVGDEVHTLIEEYSASTPDGALVHRWRANRTAPWQSEPILPPTTSTYLYNLFLFVDGADLVAVASRSGGELLMFRKSGGGAWTPIVLSPAPELRRIEHAAIGPSGEIVLFSLDKIRRIRGTAVEELALPRPVIDVTVDGGVAVDAAGRIHAAWPYAYASNVGIVGGTRSVYAVYDGAWKEYPLGVAIYPRPVPGPNGEMRVITGNVRASVPVMNLTEIAADGTQTSDRFTEELQLSPSPEYSWRMSATTGPDGTIATSFAGRRVLVKHPDRLRPPRMMTFTMTITGPGRVYSTDGRLDCTATCSVQAPLGTRLQIKWEPAPGHVVYDDTNGFPDSPVVDGFMWHDVAFDNDYVLRTEITHQVRFDPAP